jgi:hypothetical protein
MSNTWFRLYNEVVDDPKVQRLSPLLFRAWVNMMCIASKHGGKLPDIADVAYSLHVTSTKAEALLDDLIKANLFEWKDGVAHPHNWDGRQFQSDVSTGRVQRFRERHRNVSATANETDQNRTDTEQIQKQTRTEREKEPAAVGLALGEFQRCKLTQTEYDKLKVELNGHLATYIADFDRWVNEAPDAKANGVRRKDRHAYESILSWFHRHQREGKIPRASPIPTDAEMQQRAEAIFGKAAR